LANGESDEDGLGELVESIPGQYAKIVHADNRTTREVAWLVTVYILVDRMSDMVVVSRVVECVVR
jgi:hypothetical protein